MAQKQFNETFLYLSQNFAVLEKYEQDLLQAIELSLKEENQSNVIFQGTELCAKDLAKNLYYLNKKKDLSECHRIIKNPKPWDINTMQKKLIPLMIVIMENLSISYEKFET